VKNGHSIAKMAIENYLEMRDHVNDPTYRKRRKLELKMERMFPGEFIPRYSMVSFHQIPYSEVYTRGEKQLKIIEAMLEKFDDISEIDKIAVQDYLQIPTD
jgi:kynurenine 3-monooxygenase